MRAKPPAFQFYPGDWLRDLRLRTCSLRARGLWIDMLCLMHDGTPYGHLATAQGPLDAIRLARAVGAPAKHVAADLAELHEAGVFSVTEAGVIYSRRMVRDAARLDQWAAYGMRGAADGVKGGAFGHLGGRPPKPRGGGVMEPGVDGVSESPGKPPTASAVASALLLTSSVSRKKPQKSCLAEHRETAQRLLAFLNETAGRNYRAVEATLQPIAARLADGATEANCRGVIARKAREWRGTEMAKFLRPETLFNRTKFESYLGEREARDGELS